MGRMKQMPAIDPVAAALISVGLTYGAETAPHWLLWTGGALFAVCIVRMVVHGWREFIGAASRPDRVALRRGEPE